MELLTARSARLRDARALTIAKFRRARGQFLAEGPQAVGAALAAGCVVQILVAESARVRRAAELAAAQQAGLPVHIVEESAFATLVSAQTPQGIVAVCGWVPGTLAGLIAAAAQGDRGGHLVLAHELSDPGNAGALIRVADAAGALGVALSDGSVDPTNAKCVRASAGSLFHLPVVPAGDTLAAIAALRAAGVRTLAADVTPAAIDLFTAERAGLVAGRVAWILGNEAHGLPEEVLAAVEHVVRIPVLGRAESLNLATAAAVCLYATARTGQ
ncbi:MAG: RNA methyltransferase [Candidatus Nanopelagicales bacterium]